MDETNRVQIRDYRNLVVRQEAMDLAVDAYRLSAAFPDSERYGLSAQLRRAAVSVPSNIAEGFGRASRPSFIQFLRVAQGSLKELGTQIELARRLDYTSGETATLLLADSERLGKRLVTFIRSLQN